MENDRLQSSKNELERILEHTTKVLNSLPSYYKQRKDDVTTRGEEWHQHIETIVKKLHQELDDMQEEHGTLLQKQKNEFEEIIGKLDEINGKAIKLQKSKNVTEMQTFLPVIQEQKNLSDFSQFLFPNFYKCDIDKNYLQTSFGFVEKMQEKKIFLFEHQFKEKELLRRTLLEVPTVTCIIDTGFPADEEYENRLYDMAITDDNKVWMGGESRELKLFDLQGNILQTISITDRGSNLTMYNKQVLYTDTTNHAVKMISDTHTEGTMFTTGEWTPYGVTSTASGDLLVCLCTCDQSKVVRYSSTGTVLQEIQYDSQCQPLYKQPAYITEHINGDIIVTDFSIKAVIAVDRLGIFRCNEE